MKKEYQVKAAVVGCGMISDIYISNLCGPNRKYQIIDLVACCDVNRDMAEKKAEKYGLKVMTEEEICADLSIEMVINLTPPFAHYSVIKRYLQAGKHVYTEKVLSVELEEARELTELAKSRGLYLGASPDTFLGASVQTAKQLVESGLIGEVSSCLAVINRDYALMPELIPYVSRKGGGIGFDVGIYYVTALLSILGPVDSVNGYMQTNRPDRRHFIVRNDNYDEAYRVESENVMVGSLKFKSGVLGSVHFNSECIMNEMPVLTIYGTQGIVYMGNPDHFGDTVKLQRKGQTEPIAVPINFGFEGNSRGLGAAEMAWSIRKKRNNRANAQLALNALETLYGIAISSSEGHTYEVQSTFERIPLLPQGYLDDGYYNSDPEAALAL